MSTEFFNDQWRIPSNENQNKISNYSMGLNAASGNFISINNAGNSLINNATAFTISAWINPTADTGTFQNIFTNWGNTIAKQNVMIRINTSESLQFYVRTTNGQVILSTANNLIKFNQWQHVVCTYDGVNTRIYYNGSSVVPPAAQTGNVNTSTEQDQIGKRWTYGQYFNGKIDQITIFDYALSQDQVTQLGAEGYAFNFIPNDYIDLGTTTAYDTGDLSAATWVNASSSRTGTVYPFSNSGSPSFAGFDFVIYTNNEIRIRRSTRTKSNQTNQINIGFVSDTWQHLALTYSESTNTLKVFLNGVLKATNVGTNQTNTASKKLTIGSYKGTSAFFDGELSNAQVFNSKLEDSEIATLYNNGKPLTNMSGFTSLQGWWKLDDTEIFNTTSTEWSVDNNSYPSTYKSSLNFNSDYIRVNSFIFGGLTSLSISCWYNLSSISTDQGIIARWTSNPRSILLYHDAPNGWRFLINGVESFQSTHIASVNTWQHLVVVYESGAATKIYLNGVSQVKSSVASGAIPVSTSWDIGRDSGTNTKNLNGELSNLAIWDTALTDPQVQTIYNNGAPEASISHSPTSWYKLDNTTTGIQDSVGSNNGTNNGAIEYPGFVNNTAGESVGMDSSNLVASNINGELIANPMATSPKPIAYYQLGDQSVYNGGGYLVPNNSLSGYVFRSVPLRTTNSVPTDTITSNINYTGTPGLPDPFTVSFWMKDSVVGNGSVFFDHDASTYTTTTPKGAFVYFTGGKVLIYLAASYWRYYNLPSGVALTGNEWRNIVVYMNPLSNGLGKVWIDGTPLTLSNANSGSSANNFTAGFKFYLNNFGSNVMYFKDYEIDNAGATLLYNNGAPLLDTSTLAQAPDHWWKLNDDDTFNSGTSTWTINDYVGSENGTSVNMTSNNLVISDLDNTGSSVGYSPYALDFDGVDDYLDFNNASANLMTNKNAISISGWFKLDSNITGSVFSNWHGGLDVQYLLRYNTGTGIGIQWYIYSNSNTTRIDTNYFPNVGDWVHVVGVKDPITNGGQSRVYINSVEYTQNSTDLSVAIANNFRSDLIGTFRASNTVKNPMNGSISNVAYWTDTALTQSDVTEIYNKGVPSNLNTFSGTAPDHWLQIGSNSSYNSGAWTCLDEIGNLNAVSAGSMTNDDIVDGPGYSASGLGSSSIDIKGDAPYSSANGLSENMDVLDRTTDVPS